MGKSCEENTFVAQEHPFYRPVSPRKPGWSVFTYNPVVSTLCFDVLKELDTLWRTIFRRDARRHIPNDVRRDRFQRRGLEQTDHIP